MLTDQRYDATGRMCWPSLWMEIARKIAVERSTDPRLKVASLMVPEDDTGILALGYNGGPRSLYNDPLSTSPGESGFVHAEANMLIKAPYHYPLKKHVYITHSPCHVCASLLINADVELVVYGELYRDETPIQKLAEAGVAVASLEEILTFGIKEILNKTRK